MQHLFGSVFVCSDLNTAKTVAYDPRVQRKCITLDGDVVDPAGTMSGGIYTFFYAPIKSLYQS